MSEKITAGLYAIDHFSTERDQGMGMYGCSITLDAEVVKHLLKTKRNPKAPMLEMLQERLVRSLPKHSDPSIRFYEDTWLLIGMTVGGQCACMGIDGGFDPDKASRSGIRYSPHNIDSVQQAAAIVSAWLLWFNGILPTFTPYRLPFTI
jgi:hypothetical protein